jgi:hypothetical protein
MSNRACGCARQFRSERHDEQGRQTLNAIHDLIEEFTRARIEPMRVLQHQEHRPPRQPVEVSEEGSE